jgi:hypothetical protein
LAFKEHPSGRQFETDIDVQHEVCWPFGLSLDFSARGLIISSHDGTNVLISKIFIWKSIINIRGYVTIAM